VQDLRPLLTDVLAGVRSGQLTGARATQARRDIVAVVSVLHSEGDDEPINSSSATWITRECIALTESLGAMPLPTELALALGVSNRWIHAACRRVYGVSAMTFFRSRALEGAHRKFRASHCDLQSVTEVAIRWGF
jgi:AraC-like DNA-binding protein